MTDVATVVHPALRSLQACPFDLAARAALAIEGCTRLANPDRDGQPYTYAELHTEPPIALHAPWDYADVAGRLVKQPSVFLRRVDVTQDTDIRDGRPYLRITRLTVETRLVGRAELTITEHPGALDPASAPASCN